MSAPVAFAPQLTTRAVTAATTVAVNEFVAADATTGTYTVTGPSAGTSRRWGVKKTDVSGNPVTVSYVNSAGSATTLALSVQDDAKTFEPLGSGYIAVAADRGRLADDARYAMPSLTTQGAFQPALTVRLGGNAAITTISCLGIDAVDNRVFGANTTNTRIVQSDNYGVSWSASRTLPTDVTYDNVTRIVRLGAYVYMHAKTTTDQLCKIFRATAVAQTGDWTDWSAPLLTLAASTRSFQGSIEVSAWATGTNYVYVGEYGDPVGGPSMYRSADGSTWEKVWTSATNRHVHHINPDPFRPGNVYATIGDGGGIAVLKSVDSGATWTTVLTAAAWQAVQISYDAKYVWFACDSEQGTAYVMDRDQLAPYMATPNHHHNIAVPGGLPGRGVTDAVLNGTTTITSATAAFTSADVGRRISSSNNLPPNTRISVVNNATSITVNQAANTTSSGQPLRISGDLFYMNAYWGSVDPNTGVYYCVAMDTSNAGTTMGLFYIPRVGAHVELLDQGGPNISMNTRIYMLGGYLFTGQWRHPLFTSAVRPTN